MDKWLDKGAGVEDTPVTMSLVWLSFLHVGYPQRAAGWIQGIGAYWNTFP
jgi:hypothetical protein